MPAVPETVAAFIQSLKQSIVIGISLILCMVKIYKRAKIKNVSILHVKAPFLGLSAEQTSRRFQIVGSGAFAEAVSIEHDPVSYTHLDVYKRQGLRIHDETEYKLAQAIAGFLGKHMESWKKRTDSKRSIRALAIPRMIFADVYKRQLVLSETILSVITLSEF